MVFLNTSSLDIPYIHSTSELCVCAQVLDEESTIVGHDQEAWCLKYILGIIVLDLFEFLRVLPDPSCREETLENI